MLSAPWIVAVPLLMLRCGEAAAQDAQPGERVERIERDGLKMELAPLAGDQVRAFMLARGFGSAEAEEVVSKGCLFRSSIGNADAAGDGKTVAIRLADWHVLRDGQSPGSPLTREDYESRWPSTSTVSGAATAFYWALFPSHQEFAPGDYNWGFLSFGLPAGTRFSLAIRWRVGSDVHEAVVRDVECGK